MKKIQILGGGCTKSRKLAENTEAAARKLRIDQQIEKAAELDQILAFGVMATPALAVHGEVKSVGRIVSVNEIKTMMA